MFRTTRGAYAIATLALFIALGGVSYAVVKLERNSVGSKQIKNRAVKAKDLATNSVTGAKVKDGSLVPADFGESLATNVTRRDETTLVIPADGFGSASTPCDPGERAVGGGHLWISGNAPDVLVVDSYPVADDSGVPTGWETSVFNQDVNDNDAGDLEVRPYVVCAT